jgi:hypothetical protein
MRKRFIRFVFAAGLLAFLTGHLAAPPAIAAVTLEVHNPRGEIAAVPVRGILPRLNNLDGKKIALVDNGKAGADYFLDAIEELVKTRLPGVTILRFKKPGGSVAFVPQFYAAVAQKCDAFILATGD